MAPREDGPTSAKNQPPAKLLRRPRRARRPRRRVCLLKGCGRISRPQQPMARYCSEACQAEARRWRQWKARHRWRQSTNGTQKRQAQSRRYRERRKAAPERKAVTASAARIIPIKFLFVLLRPSGVLCGVRPHPAITVAAVLFSLLSSRAGTGSGAGAGKKLLSNLAAPFASLRAGSAAMKACRYRPDILHSVFLSR
jgi:hypothetical protein